MRGSIHPEAIASGPFRLQAAFPGIRWRTPDTGSLPGSRGCCPEGGESQKATRWKDPGEHAFRTESAKRPKPLLLRSGPAGHASMSPPLARVHAFASLPSSRKNPPGPKPIVSASKPGSPAFALSGVPSALISREIVSSWISGSLLCPREAITTHACDRNGHPPKNRRNRSRTLPGAPGAPAGSTGRGPAEGHFRH